LVKYSKLLLKLKPILLNGFKSGLTPLLSILFSYLIVNYFSKNLWGEFVNYLLFFYLTAIFTNWGNKMFLIRKFSLKPKNMVVDFQEYFLARIPILFLFILGVLFYFETSIWVYLLYWVIGVFIYNSFIPLIFFFRDFSKQIFIELISYLSLLLLIFFNQEEFNLKLLIKFYSFHYLIKAILIALVYSSFLKVKKIRLRISLLKFGFPFLFLALTGFLQSKIDLYTLSFFSSSIPLGEYQIISGFFIFSQSIASIILLPYLRNIYRMKSFSLKKIKRLMIKLGFLITVFISIIIYYILQYYFGIKITLVNLIAGFFIGFPSYIYVIHVFYLFKVKSEKTVGKICVIGLSINFLLSFILLYLGFEITGALIANACAQVLVTFFYLRNKINDKVFKKNQ
jgi:hypothetical protein